MAAASSRDISPSSLNSVPSRSRAISLMAGRGSPRSDRGREAAGQRSFRAPFPLFNGDALGQVPGLIDVQPPRAGQVIAQELQRDHGEARGEVFERLNCAKNAEFEKYKSSAIAFFYTLLLK